MCEDVRSALKDLVTKAMSDAIPTTDCAKRKTVTAMDVVALKR